MEKIYQATLSIVGFRVRPDLTIRQFTIAVAALTEGCVLRNRVDTEQMNGILRPTGPEGENSRRGPCSALRSRPSSRSSSSLILPGSPPPPCPR